jgi:hypothetical protein
MKKIVYWFFMPAIITLLLAGCKKVDFADKNVTEQSPQAAFKNAAAAPAEFAADVTVIQNYFAGRNPFGAASGSFLWPQTGTLQNTSLVVVPYTLNGSFGGFLLLNKLRPRQRLKCMILALIL